VNAAQYARLPAWRRDWLIRHLWREGLAPTPYDVSLLVQHDMTEIRGDGPGWWRVWLRRGGDFDVRRVRAEPRWDFDALIRHG
jgi:hypothetical protein